MEMRGAACFSRQGSCTGPPLQRKLPPQGPKAAFQIRKHSWQVRLAHRWLSFPRGRSDTSLPLHRSWLQASARGPCRMTFHFAEKGSVVTSVDVLPSAGCLPSGPVKVRVLTGKKFSKGALPWKGIRGWAGGRREARTGR